jgi:tyrosyl-tRNA synthetase
MAGRTLPRAFGQRPQVPVCVPILIGTDGHLRMSKTQGNHIALTDPPDEMYGKVMSLPDHLIEGYFTLVTRVPADELEEIRRQLRERSVNPMVLKKRLARDIVGQYHSVEAADAAKREFERVFQRREAPEQASATQRMAAQISELFGQPGGEWKIRHVSDSLKELMIPFGDRVGLDVPSRYSKPGGSGCDLATLLVDAGLVGSIAEAKRLVQQGAVDEDGVRLTSRYLTNRQIRPGATIRVGKHRFLRIVDADKEQPGELEGT